MRFAFGWKNTNSLQEVTWNSACSAVGRYEGCLGWTWFVGYTPGEDWSNWFCVSRHRISAEILSCMMLWIRCIESKCLYWCGSLSNGPIIVQVVYFYGCFLINAYTDSLILCQTLPSYSLVLPKLLSFNYCHIMSI